MADYLQDFEFDFEHEFQQPQQNDELYSCSLDSSTESLPELDEVSTPLLYDSKINTSNTYSRSSSIDSVYLQDFDESFIELDINKEILPSNLNFNYHIQSPKAAPLNSDINNIIKQGSNHLKNNYKLWLNKTI